MCSPQIRTAVAIICFRMQDCIIGNSKQIFVVAVIHKTGALTDTFNADFLSFFRLYSFGKGFPKKFDQILPHKIAYLQTEVSQSCICIFLVN